MYVGGHHAVKRKGGRQRGRLAGTYKHTPTLTHSHSHTRSLSLPNRVRKQTTHLPLGVRSKLLFLVHFHVLKDSGQFFLEPLPPAVQQTRVGLIDAASLCSEMNPCG